MNNSETSRIGRPTGVRLEDVLLREGLSRADSLDAGAGSEAAIREKLGKVLGAAVDQHGFYHAIPMQVMICIVDRWVGYRGSIGAPILAGVLEQVRNVWRGERGRIDFNDNVCNVLLRLAESCARAGLTEEGLQFMALNEVLVESWRGPNHTDHAGAIYNQARYLHLVGRNSEAQAEYSRALGVKGGEGISQVREQVQRALDRIAEGAPHHEFADPGILRPWLCLLESSLSAQRRKAAETILQICRENRHLDLREEHEGIGKAKADSEPDVWQPVALARLHLADSPAHFEAARVLEIQRSDPDDAVRERAMALLSSIPVGKIEGDLFDRIAIHLSKTLLSPHREAARHAARCLDECAGWKPFPFTVVKTVCGLLESGPVEFRDSMMGILYSAAQYGDTDLTSARDALERAHERYPELRPRPGRTLCRHLESVTGEKYIEDPSVELDLPEHWRGEQTRVPLYGSSGKEEVNRFSGVGGCAHCGNDRPGCIYSSGNGDRVCEFHCAQCGRFTNYRYHPDPGNF